MSASDVTRLCGTIVQVATFLQTSGNDWYKAKQEWKELPQKVSTLQTRCKIWEGLMKIYGCSYDEDLLNSLEYAKSLLSEEQVKLEKLQKYRTARLRSKVSKTVFPVQIGQSIDAATKAFDDMLTTFLEKGEIRAALRSDVLQSIPPLPFKDDDRYVPLQETEMKVRWALENTGELRPVVLLHGRAGTGKSSVARRLALEYEKTGQQNTRKMTEAPESESNTSSSSQSAPSQKNLIGESSTRNSLPVLFDQVVYLQCGPKAGKAAIKNKLRQSLGWDVEDKASGQGQDTNTPLEKSLIKLMSERRLLIVLDDVWEPEFLGGIVKLRGKNVKFLVTSQLGDLCRLLNFKSEAVLIEDVTPETAREILSSHAEMATSVSPQAVQEYMDAIAEKVGRNPHAMASVATAIEKSSPGDLRCWERALDKIAELLSSKGTAHLYDEKYPHSFWGAMQMSLDALEQPAKNLMLLLSLCEGENVPEEVLEMFFENMKNLAVEDKTSCQNFSRAKIELEYRQKIKVIGGSWSMHSLDEDFLQIFTDADRRSMLDSIQKLLRAEIGLDLEGRQENKILNVLVSLYFRAEFAKAIGSKMVMSVDQKVRLRRNAIEPVTRLLVKNVGKLNGWTPALHSAVREVFLSYICYQSLREDLIGELFKSSLSSTAMLDALQRFADIENICVGEFLPKDFPKDAEGIFPVGVVLGTENDCKESGPDMLLTYTEGKFVEEGTGKAGSSSTTDILELGISAEIKSMGRRLYVHMDRVHGSLKWRLDSIHNAAVAINRLSAEHAFQSNIL